MTWVSKVVIASVAVAVIGVGGAVVLGGAFAQSKDTYPPCEQLPSAAEASAALTGHRALADEIEALGTGISVKVGKPCPDGQDRALIEVVYGSESEHDAIGDLLGRRDGFGVPVRLVEH